MMTEDEVKAYHQGVREGIARFAWWRDGVQYVGTCGKTLKEVLVASDIDESNDLARIAAKDQQ